MKKFCIIIGISLWQMWAFAAHVPVGKAQTVGQHFLSQQSQFSGILPVQLNLQLVYTEGVKDNNQKSNEDGITYFYVFNAGNQGFVIVAGDDRVLPILGYADKGSFDPENIPINCKKWLEGYKNEIRYVVENEIIATEEIEQKWSDYYDNVKQKQRKGAVAPLLTTTWSQSPYYNDLCPYDYTYSNRTVTGCVATAMAQVMKYWNHPTQGAGYHSYNHSTYGTLSANFGSVTYDWANMPNNLTSSTATQKNAVATLMYHCGVSVDMDYGVSSQGGSAAYMISSASPITHCSEYAFKTYFGYKSTLQGVKKNNYANASWISLLKTELNASRPIVYAGFGEGGHCFVCDGYDNYDYFHFNWGWGGYLDGYFAVTSLNPGGGGTGSGSGSYTNNQQAIIGLEPQTSGTQTFDLAMHADLSTSQSSYWFGNSITVTASIENNGTGAFSGEIVASVFNSQGAFISDISAPQSISLNPNTYTTKIFTHAGGVPFIPGDYHVRVFYRTIGGLWTLVPHDYGILLDEINYAEFTVTYSSDIETNSAFTISNNGGKLIQGSSATVNVDIKNTGASTFYGSYKVCLLNLEGITQQDIQTLTDNNGLPSTYHYSNGVDFSGTITVDPGTYLLTLAYQPQGTGVWYYAGSSNYSNPVYVIVEAPAIPPDIYEVNDVFSQSHSLTASFSNNNATVSTTGATLHTGTDIDYYKIILPSGYNYTLTPRLHDAYNSGNGQTYTVDASFSYSVDGGNNWSETYDDIVYSNITINNGGTIYFKVAPYFTGNTGTYLLNVSISRTEIQSNNADLATLTVNPGTLTPAFNAGIFNYIVEEPYSVTSITINATAADANATIIGRGGFALNVGQNIFHVIVTAQDGVTQKDYTVIVTRANNTSIAESNISALQIYPNPASSELKIKNYQLEDGENVEIIDVLGRVQKSTIINQQSEIIIDVSHLAKGMYFIKIGNWRGKFVVN